MKTLKIFFLLLSTIYVQQGLSQGSISGTVLDGDIGETLIGANVVIDGTAIGTSTDFDGKYQFQVDPGIYTVVVSYLGFSNKKIEGVEIKDGETTYLDVTMTTEGVDLGVEVVVQAKAIERSENAVLMLQRKSDKILDGISAQEMSRYAVGSAAGAMKKVTGATVSGGKYIYIRGLGDRYSLSQLNGLIIPSTDPYRNGAQLDLIPSNLLDNIITSKTFTPDQPGTFTGGNVDIKTKNFPEQFSLTVSVSGGYNEQNNLIDDFLTHDGGANDYWGFDDGTRARPSFFNSEVAQEVLSNGTDIPLIVRSQNIYNRLYGDSDIFSSREDFANQVDRVSKSLTQDFVSSPSSTPINHGFSIAYGDQFEVGGKPLGVILSTSFSQQYQHLPAFEKANWWLQFAEDESLFNQGNFEETLSTQSPTLNGMLGLAYKLNTHNSITTNFIYNHSTDKISRFIFGERPDNIVAPDFLQGRSSVFKERELFNIQLGGTHLLPRWNNVEVEWKVSQANSTLIEPDTRFFENQLQIVTNSSGEIVDTTYSIPASNVQRPFHFFRDLEDEQQDAKLDITIPLSSNRDSKVKVGGLYSKKDRDFTEQRYQIEETFGVAKPYDGNPTEYLADDNYGLISSDPENGEFILANYITDVSELRNSYVGSEEVLALYGMISTPITPRLKFVGGARVENTDIEVIGADTFQLDEDRIANIDVSDVLPSANLIYALSDEMNLRASFSQTIARPNMREVAPFEAFDPLTREIYLGNVDLDRTLIQNYDLRWEYFFNPGEMIALSGYYKSFDDPIIQAYRRAPNPEIEFTNVESAELYGIEFELRKNLMFISPYLENFKFNTNLSIIESSADVVALVPELEPDERPFEGQADYIFNASLIYTSKDQNWDATMTFNSLGDRLRIVGREGTPDIYDRGRTQLDFNLIRRIDDFNITISAKNLTNSPYLISSEYKGNEFVYSRFKLGVTFGAGVSYTFR